MKIELRRIEYSERMSEETSCYAADVYVDGKKVGMVSNDGHGGCDYQHIDRDTLDRLNAWCRENLPPMDFSDLGGAFKMDPKPQDFEDYCHDLLMEHLHVRDMKRALKAKALFTTPGDSGIRYIAFKQKGKTWPDQVIFDHIEKKHPGSTILNQLPVDEALRIWRAAE